MMDTMALDPTYIAEQSKLTRKLLGWTQENLADAANLTIETLQQWLALIDEAYDLISGSGDDCTADETADLAAYYIRKEIRNIEAAARTPLTTYDQLNGRLQDAYDLLGNLPRLAHPGLDARVQRVVELLDELTHDTHDADKLAEAGIDPNGPVERTLHKEAA